MISHLSIKVKMQSSKSNKIGQVQSDSKELLEGGEVFAEPNTLIVQSDKVLEAALEKDPEALEV